LIQKLIHHTDEKPLPPPVTTMRCVAYAEIVTFKVPNYPIPNDVTRRHSNSKLFNTMAVIKFAISFNNY